MDSQKYEMVGALDVTGTFEGMKLHLGYRELQMPAAHEASDSIRGHEFHYSDILIHETADSSIGVQYSAKGKKVKTKLFRYKNLIAGYTHFYWANRCADES